MQNFRNLLVWKKSHELTLRLYEVTSDFPKHELFGLTSQIRRAGSSIPANIAEGCGRDGGADLARFLQIAFGSASELEYHIILAHDLGYISENDYVSLETGLGEVKRMLTGLIQRLRTKPLLSRS